MLEALTMYIHAWRRRTIRRRTAGMPEQRHALMDLPE